MRSSRRGLGSETASIRAYQPGDDVRRIDWGASARLSAVYGNDEFVVRDDYAEQARAVVLAIDTGPSMALYPESSPWLCKPLALEACAVLVSGAARAERCPLLVSAGAGVERPERHGRRGVAQHVRGLRFDGGTDALACLLASLPELRVPGGSFVFVLSDFLADVPEAVWRRLARCGLDVIPVVLQEPLLERRFPAVGGAYLPIAEPLEARKPQVTQCYKSSRLVRLSRREARRLRERNEQRFAGLVRRFESLGLDWIDATTADATVLHRAFWEWSRARLARRGARAA